MLYAVGEFKLAKLRRFFAVHNLICGNFQTWSGSSLCGDQSRSRGRNRAISSLLPDNSRCPRLARLDSLHRAIPFTLWQGSGSWRMGSDSPLEVPYHFGAESCQEEWVRLL